MQYKYLRTEIKGEVLWIEIHNPPMNFLTTDLLEEMHLLFKRIRKENSIKVLVLTGGVEDTYIMHFSISELERLTVHNRRLLLNIIIKIRPLAALIRLYMTFNNWLMDCFSWYEWIQLKLAKLIRKFSIGMFLWYQMTRLYFTVERLNKITIAAINGPCNGGGTELSLCFDFRFMVGDKGFTIGQPEGLIGIIPGGGGTQRLPRLIGRAKALEIMLGCDQIAPPEAKEMNLITDHFKKKDFRKNVQIFAERMCRRPPVAMAAIKKSVYRGMDTTLSRGLSIELEQSIRCFDTKDARMALKQYEKFIKNSLSIPSEKRPDIKDVVSLLDEGKLFNKFQGK